MLPTPSSSKASSLIVVRLYRNLLRAAKPFTAPSPYARVLNCLLHRTGIDDHITDWTGFVSNLSEETSQDRARDLTVSYYDEPGTSSSPKIPPNRAHQRLFRRLLREVVCSGDSTGIRKSTWPSMVDPTILRNVIQREFKQDGPECASFHFDPSVRQQVAFAALQELNKKLSYWEYLLRTSPIYNPRQGASNVSRLPFLPSSSYLQPGAFLLSHPHMNDSFFAKSVICLLEHKTDNTDISSESEAKRKTTIPGQTYGVIVNRINIDPATGKPRTLNEAFEENMLPGKLADVFGDSVVREGGPVHVSLQMLHAASISNEEAAGEKDTTDESGKAEDAKPRQIGGRIIPMIPKDGDPITALEADEATMFEGDVFKAMAAVEDGSLPKDKVSFFVGASTWSEDQLRDEVAQGFWIPCRGPPQIALTGKCEYAPESESSKSNMEDNNQKAPLQDLWLSMMSACGEEEAYLAHLFYNEDDPHGYGLPCDAFDEEDLEF